MENKDNLNKSKKITCFGVQSSSLVTLGLVGGISAMSLLSVSCNRESQVQEDKKKLELVGYDFNQDGLFKAAAQDNIEALKIFKANKFDLTVTDLLGRTAVHAAANSGAVRSLNFFSENGADLEALDKQQTTPLMLAAAGGKLEVIQFLLKSGVPTQMRDSQKKFALLHAIDGNSVEAIRLIAPHNRELLDTALLYASDQNKPEAVEPLIQYGASVYARSQGMTSLMIASMKGHDKVAEKLLTHGANPYAVSEDGKLAKDYAQGNEKVLAALQAGTTSTDEDGSLALEWNEKELENVVRNAMERYHETEMEALKNTGSENVKAEDGTTVAKVNIPAPPTVPTEVKVASIRGKTLPIKVNSAQDLQTEMSMANYAEKPFPLIMNAEEPGSVEIHDLRNPAADPVAVKEGVEIGMTGLKVTQIKKRIINSKMTGGRDKEFVTLLVKDEKTGKSREIYSGYESTAADAVAVVRLKQTGDHWVVRRDDTFTDADGVLYKVTDVNQEEVLVENTESKEITRLPLMGINH